MQLGDPRRSRVILVGSAHYEDARLAALPAVANNLADLAAVFTDPALGGLAPESCHVLLDITADQTTRVQRLAREAEDLLLIYFAGHSVFTSQGQIAFAMRNTESDLADYNVWTVGQLRSAITNSPARVCVLVLDSCYSERALRELGAMGPTDAQLEIVGTYTLASASKYHPAVAPPGARHTAFTGELIDLLRTGVPDAGDLLSMHTIFRDLNRRLLRQGLPSPKQLNTNTAENLALVRNRSATPVVAIPAQIPRWQLTRSRALDPAAELGSRMAAVDELASLAGAPEIAQALTTLAGDLRLPILLRIHCVHKAGLVLGPAVASVLLTSFDRDPSIRPEWAAVAAFLRLLDDHDAWYAAMSPSWDIDPVLGSDDPDQVWGLLMAMTLHAFGLSEKARHQAVHELAVLGKPAQAEALLNGLSGYRANAYHSRGSNR
ncbi:caspase, EACC1-associated type [Actinokineospora enzanensis]|uniref:caspase, EACC1-associated type n=1 Tax=Actinokineospora enzanensis TaxID=155975 RepID=UPI0003A81FD7|nr:caspase family protein [Actinokineospora enzanensis]